jgi:transglutaminase-like putative cysteine protease
MGEIGGYHCWAEFWAEGRGWVPLDASEARKHPELREELFGRLPADRVAFTRGRDYALPGAAAGPVNFLIYPYVEVDGEPFTSVEKSFSYTAATAE